MATKSASRTKRASPVASKPGGSPSSSIASFSPSVDSAPPPLAGPAPSSPGAQSFYSESVFMDGGRSKENVTVTVRFRPLSPREIRQGEEVAWYADGDTIVRNEHNPSVAYAYDRVFGPTTTTRHVYDVAAQHIVASAMEGINGTVFAYGVTSSGKTHTMHGDQRSPGVIPLAVKDVFSIIQETPSREFLLRVSYLEIYNEVVNDLLNPAGQNLRIREDVQGTFVEGLTEEVVLSPAHALSLIAAGEEHRHVGSNNFNLLSSRSHTIFTLTIESSPCGDSNEGEAVTLSQLNLIDLAGSESSRVETTGVRRKEGSYINKSLLTLGTVIAKLTDGRASHIPYRDSKLTRLLQSSLSGHGVVSLICTVTPSSRNMEETHNTLKFAHRAKCIEIQASQNKIIDEQSLIKKYQNEIRSLKEELEQLKRGIVNVPSLKDPGQEDIVLLKQKLEDGQFKLQSRLEQEEEAKAALLGRIQRLTKLILVSTKAAHSSRFPQRPGPRRRHSFGEEELAYLPYKRRDFIIDEEAIDTSVSPEGRSNNVEEIVKEEKRNRKHGLLNWFKTRKRENNLPASPDGDKSSETRSTVAPSTPQSEAVNFQAEHYTSNHANATGEVPSADQFLKAIHKSEASTENISLTEPPVAAIKFGDQIDLLMEQVKILSGEVALSSSTLKRYSEDAIDNPKKEQIEIEMKKLNDEILEKKQQMAALEKSMIASIQASQNNMDSLELSQSFADLAVQLTEKSFELEVKSADNRVMQEQLQEKVRECEELQENIASLKQQLSDALTAIDANAKAAQVSSVEAICQRDFSLDESKKGFTSESFVQSQVIDELNQRIQKLTEEKCQLETRNQKLAEESSYAKELASAAAVELKALSEEVTKLMRNNEKLTTEIASLKTPPPRRVSGGTINSKKHGLVKQQNQGPSLAEVKRELASSRERELSYEAALVEKEQKEAQLQKMIEESKERESYLENELANMWVLVAKLKKSRETDEDNVEAQDTWEKEKIENCKISRKVLV
ncbi:kinesin-like protein KIN-7D, chloroplastic isoform X2 [Nymphaea colorata]|uniref:kinesin-like protein KIN-7D, chloroplastic isoform X2 n=1 Tax=Nymphaea colorata TaxID=210225 RepID=UPI00129EC5B9|nr:kinesin-like protein KIN-7D, chloroplastic isoform X2 [Nymphaea colorata]